MPEQPLTVIPPQPLTEAGSEPGPGALTLANSESILRLAIEKGTPPDSLEKILAMHERMKAAAAKEAFDAAMAAFQAECPVIRKTSAGYQNAYFFAPLDKIISQVRELLRIHGFSYKLTSDTEIDQTSVKAVIKVTHTAGHSEVSEFKCPIDNNPKNMMSTPQRYGAAMTFAKRYAFCNAFGIMTGDEDTDTADRRQKPKIGPQGRQQPPPAQDPDPSPRQSAPPAQSAPASSDEVRTLKGQIWNHVRAHFKDDNEAFQQFLWDEGIISDTEALATLPASRLKQLLAAMKERIK